MSFLFQQGKAAFGLFIARFYQSLLLEKEFGGKGNFYRTVCLYCQREETGDMRLTFFQLRFLSCKSVALTFKLFYSSSLPSIRSSSVNAPGVVEDSRSSSFTPRVHVLDPVDNPEYRDYIGIRISGVKMKA